MTTQREGQVITEECAKCGESFETVLESDGEGGLTAMSVCESCFDQTVSNERS